MRDAMLFLHFLGLILGMGAGFASLIIAASNKDLSREDRPKFMLRLRGLGYMGLAGIGLLIISGGYLATPYWSAIETMPFFITKLILVVLLLTLALLMDRRWRRAVKSGGGPDLLAIPKLGRLAFPIGILIVLLAVLQFH
jgi:uncharacterized membrane protein